MVIETERMICRNWTDDDINDLVEGLNNFNVAKNLTVPFPFTIDDAKSFIVKAKAEKESNYIFAIVLKENKKVIGGTNINVHVEKTTAFGGLWLNEKYQGKGYGTEILKARAKFCFENLGLEKINNGFLEGNEISWHIQRKMGYKIIGESTKYCQARGGETREIITELTKNAFYRAITT